MDIFPRVWFPLVEEALDIPSYETKVTEEINDRMEALFIFTMFIHGH